MMKNTFEHFRKIQKKTKPKRKLPKNKSSGKWLRRGIWLTIFLVGFAGLSGYFKSVRALKEIESTKASNVNAQVVSVTTDRPMEIFAENFIKAYFHRPLLMEQESYTDGMKKYFANGFPLEDISNVGARELISSSLFDVEKKKNYSVLIYQVAYNNITNQMATRIKQVPVKQGKKIVQKKITEKYTKEVKSKVTCLVHVPVQSVKGAYSVVDAVYYTTIPNLATSNGDVVTDDSANQDLDAVSTKQQGKVESFLQNFFENYASGTKEDMAFMMKNPETLDGMKQYKEIVSMRAYNQKQGVLVKVKVSFTDKQSSGTDVENFTLDLSKKEGQYFVSKLTHTLGGN
ncbi:conjugal transfer protein [Listeria rustica]|uniref:Conjugal transfer protein n=1 Tax=Listeria rustica TaxID=2713503 RepID=A0A7W1YFF5_9LIST|nr:conjugal transfer protein [Listeria rustica]MBA3925533.1 conjugal transfer protein [Listeria rustica]